MSMNRDAGEFESREQEEIVRSLVDDLREAFLAYIRGDIEFDELTFDTYDTLQAAHAIRTGNYTVEYVDEEESDSFLQDDMSKEPGRESNGTHRRRRPRDQ